MEIDKAFPNGWGLQFEYNIPHYCTNREQRRAGPLRGIEVIRWILYADDMVLFRRSASDAERLLNTLNDTCKRFGLTISFKKTKTQVFNNNELATKEHLFSIGPEKIENVQSFTYLGHVITNNENDCFTDHRIARAVAKFNELRTVLCDTNVNIQTRRKILETCVKSRLIYGTAAWFPNEHHLKKKEQEVDYGFVYTNKQIQQILRTVSLQSFICSQHLKYIAHVCQNENTSLTKILFVREDRKKLLPGSMDKNSCTTWSVY